MGDGEVILVHNEGSTLFNATWDDYKEGLESTLSSDYFLGNLALHHQTSQISHILRIEFWLKNGSYFYSEYKGFGLSPELFDYAMEIAEYSGGTAGDGGLVGISNKFQTVDHGDSNQCALTYAGGWWWDGGCSQSSLTSYNISWESLSNDDDGDGIGTVMMRMKPDIALLDGMWYFEPAFFTTNDAK